MTLMAHQNALILLFLAPDLRMIDPSHTLDKYSVSVEVDKKESVDLLNRQFQTHKPVKSNKCEKIVKKSREKYKDTGFSEKEQ